MKDVKIILGLLAVLTAFAAGFVLHAARSVFVPLAIAIFLSYMIKPFVRLGEEKLKIPPMLTTLFLIVLLFCAVGLGGRFIRGLVAEQAEFVDQLRETGRQLLAKSSVISEYLDLNNIDWDSLELDSLDTKNVDLNNFKWGRRVLLKLFTPRDVGRYVNSAFNVLSKTGLVIFFLIFILLGSPYLDLKIRKAFEDNEGRADQLMTILNSISGQISRFLSGMTAINGASGLLIWAGLELIGVKYALTWGVLAFFLNYIPTVGAIVSAVPPILMSIVQFKGKAGMSILGVAPEVIMTILCLLAVMILGYLAMTKGLGESMNLSPVVILTSLMLWTWLWGIAGALLSMPIAAIIKIVCDNVGGVLKPVGVLMGSGMRITEERAVSSGKR